MNNHVVKYIAILFGLIIFSPFSDATPDFYFGWMAAFSSLAALEVYINWSDKRREK